MVKKMTSLEKLNIKREKDKKKDLSKKNKIETLSPKEEEVINNFLNTGDRVASYNKVFNKKKDDTHIYRFFRQQNVIQKIIEAGNELSIYDTVCDIKLLSIINDPNASHKNQINAIKEWNNLRNRVHTNIKVEQVQNLDFTDLSDDGLQKIIDAFTPKIEDIEDIEYQEINNTDNDE